MSEFFYFLVTGSKSWTLNFHENFFNVHGGFFWGVIGALIIGVICALVFYFGCCNSKKSAAMANIGVWAGFLVVCALIGYIYADMIVIGKSGNVDQSSIFYRYSFYKANNEYYIDQTNQPNVPQTTIKELQATKNQIESELDKGGDVRFSYDLTTAILALIFYFITSLIVKRFTINGKTIPCKNP